jgi:hypothetical protein
MVDRYILKTFLAHCAVNRSGIYVWPAAFRILRIPAILPLLSDLDIAYACEGNGDRFI